MNRHKRFILPASQTAKPGSSDVKVSTDAQETHLQLDALKAADCDRIYEEKASAAKKERLNSPGSSIMSVKVMSSSCGGSTGSPARCGSSSRQWTI
jgi:hypothetical protein